MTATIADVIPLAAPCRRYAVLRRGPHPPVRVCWLMTAGRKFQRGRGEPVPRHVGQVVVEQLVRATGCDAWLEPGGVIGVPAVRWREG